MTGWTRKKALHVGVVVALVLILPVKVAVTWADANVGAGRSLVVPQRKPDPLPAGTEIKDLARNCGVAETTAKTLAPGADKDPERGGAFRRGGPGDCMWYSLDDGKAKCDWCPKSARYRNERVLRIKIQKSDGSSRSPWPISPTGEAMQTFSRAPSWLPTQPDGTTRVPREPVAGLGDEAAVFYATESTVEGAIVYFRVGNAVAEVRYGGWDRKSGGEQTLPRDKAVAGAMKAAAETARSLGAPAQPTRGAPPADTTPVIHQTRKVCGMVSRPTVKAVVRGVKGSKGPDISLTKVPGSTSERCAWYKWASLFSSAQKHELNVTVDYLPDVRSATREYVRLHHDGQVDKRFSALAAPGDQSFGSLRSKQAYGEEASTEGLVVFRIRNVLVEVTYEGLKDDKDIAPDRAINSAYTVALDVAKALSG